ncbi:MAG: flavodoxin domain-containing protein [Bacteroidales bacterium]
MKIIITFIITLIMNGMVFSQSKAKNILIAYGSFSGSTKEIVDSMKTYLANDSTWIEIFPAEKKKIELGKYDLIIIGSAIHGNAPHSQVLDFIDANRNELIRKDVAVFAVCGTITSTKEKKRANALTYPDKIAHGLSPVTKNVFAGKLPSSGKKFDDFMAKLFLGIVTGDFRDWEKIKNWTVETVNKN